MCTACRRAAEPALSIGGEVSLSAGGSVGERPAAVIIDRDPAHVRTDNPDTYGAVIVEYADGEQVDVKHAGGPEYGAVSVTLAPGRLLEGAWTDLTEWIHYYGIDGVDLDDWISPTTEAPYNAPPLYQWPLAAGWRGDPAATVLSWVEGPDFDGATEQVTGGWALVLANPATGDEVIRLDLGDPGDVLLHADFDGRYWVGSFDVDAEDEVNVGGRVIVVDTTAAEPAPVDAECADGVIATIDRAGGAAPAPTTTAAPTTTTPVCPTYEPNDRYPIRLCDEGPAVTAVQQALVAAGHELDVDGYFGESTEEEVRRFQDAHELEVDGLVGDDTWAALIPFAPPTGSDSDGSGVVDPWELSSATETTADGQYEGLVYYVGDGNRIVADTGEEIAGLEWQAQLPVEYPGAVPRAVVHVTGADAVYVWLVEIRVADAPATWEVLQAVETPGADVVLTDSCTVVGGTGSGRRRPRARRPAARRSPPGASTAANNSSRSTRRQSRARPRPGLRQLDDQL